MAMIRVRLRSGQARLRQEGRQGKQVGGDVRVLFQGSLTARPKRVSPHDRENQVETRMTGKWQGELD